MTNLFKVAYSFFLKILLFPFRLFPVKADRLAFTGLTGGTAYEYSCNPKYICEYICEHMPGKFQIFWVVSDPERYRVGERDNIVFLKHYSLRSFYYLLTAKVIVTSGSYAPWFPFRKQQYLINTWHGGGAYKRLKDNYDEADWASRRKLQFCADNISLFLSSCRKASELLFRGAFHYGGEIMEQGMPRNDCLVNGDTQAGSDRVHAYFQIPRGDKIVLYAPTYRALSKDVVLDGERLLRILEKDGERWHLLFRAHRYQTQGGQICIENADFSDAGGYPDMQELLCAADVFITDYSSAIWDYSFLWRPCFLYVPDLKEYTSGTGFYVDISQWPYPRAADMDQLIREIETYSEQDMREAVRRHHEMMGCCESGHACEAVAERIVEQTKR